MFAHLHPKSGGSIEDGWRKKSYGSHFLFSYSNNTHCKHSVAPRWSCINRVSMTRQPRFTQWRHSQSFLSPLYCLNTSSYWLMVYTHKSTHILVVWTQRQNIGFYQSKHHLHGEKSSSKWNVESIWLLCKELFNHMSGNQLN